MRALLVGLGDREVACAVRNMVFDKTRNSLWFGTDAKSLARAHLP